MLNRRMMHHDAIVRIIGLTITSTNGTEPEYAYVPDGVSRGAIVSDSGSLKFKAQSGHEFYTDLYPIMKPSKAVKLLVHSDTCDVAMIELKIVNGKWIRQRSSGWTSPTPSPDHDLSISNDTEAVYIICRQAGVDAGVVTSDMLNSIILNWG